MTQPYRPSPSSYKPFRYYTIALLRAIRDQQVSDWDSLKRFQRENGLEFIEWGTAYVGQPPDVLSLLRELRSAGLIEVSGVDIDLDILVRPGSSEPAPEGKVIYNPQDENSPSPPADLALHIDISSQWRGIQSTLGISLKSLADLQDVRAMIVVPEFPEAKPTQEYTEIFVVMPFLDKLEGVYKDHISRVCRQLSRSVSRADDFFGAHSVMADIWGAIKAAEVIIADCTHRNPNVFYELGLAHTLGKQAILISQSAEDVPFDVRHIRYIKYDYTPPGMKEFERTLKVTLSNIS